MDSFAMLFWTLLFGYGSFQSAVHGMYGMATVMFVFMLIFGAPLKAFRWLRTKLPW